MAWKEMNTAELAKNLGMNAKEVQEKQKLMQLIVKVRKVKGLSQAALAKKYRKVAWLKSRVASARLR